MTTTPDSTTEIDIQKEAGELVANNIYCNVGPFMEFCINKANEGSDDDNPISQDDIDFCVDPDSWDDKELKQYLDENFGKSWEDVTGESWPEENTKEQLKEVRSYITQNSERQARIDFGEGPVKDWDEDILFRFLEDEMGDSWSDITGHRFPGTEIREDETDQVKQYIRENADPREVYEWWAIDSWLGKKLTDRGHIVLDLGFMTVWGREGTGQAIKMDYDIQQITLDILKQRAAYA